MNWTGVRYLVNYRTAFKYVLTAYTRYQIFHETDSTEVSIKLQYRIYQTFHESDSIEVNGKLLFRMYQLFHKSDNSKVKCTLPYHMYQLFHEPDRSEVTVNYQTACDKYFMNRTEVR